MICAIFGVWCATAIPSSPSTTVMTDAVGTISSCTCRGDGKTWPCRLTPGDNKPSAICYAEDAPRGNK